MGYVLPISCVNYQFCLLLGRYSQPSEYRFDFFYPLDRFYFLDPFVLVRPPAILCDSNRFGHAIRHRQEEKTCQTAEKTDRHDAGEPGGDKPHTCQRGEHGHTICR